VGSKYNLACLLHGKCIWNFGANWRSCNSVPNLDDNESQNQYVNWEMCCSSQFALFVLLRINCRKKTVRCWERYRVVRQWRWGFAFWGQRTLQRWTTWQYATCAALSSPTKLTLNLEMSRALKSAKVVHQKKKFPLRYFRFVSFTYLQSWSNTR
jgi:hypothetical protein